MSPALFSLLVDVRIATRKYRKELKEVWGWYRFDKAYKAMMKRAADRKVKPSDKWRVRYEIKYPNGTMFTGTWIFQGQKGVDRIKERFNYHKTHHTVVVWVEEPIIE